MYSSWSSAHRRASSRGTDWFCPSGSSVAMKVEPFERDTTSVCTFRFPYFVARAFGISAASALSSAGEGFSITRAAIGGLNAIFATSRSFGMGEGSYPGLGAFTPAASCGTERNESEKARGCVASTVVEARHDVLVVGAGCAGMRAAIEAFDAGADVALISKIHPVRSHSGAAEGGINAALGNASEDDPEKHAFDTVKGSDYLGDQDAIEVLCNEAPGHVLIQVLYEQVMKRDIRTYEEFFAWKLVVDDGRCQGVITWDLLNGGIKSIGAKTVILATGGAGRLYTGTTNAYACTGDGMALALRVGVPLKDMEMMQFHPTTLSPTGILITEGCRGEGAYLLNGEGERFLARYAPNAMELASRDVISRAEQTEIDEGRGVDGDVLLDLRHLGAVETDLDGKTTLDALYAAGECACVSVHGANRLGGNALMETITFGKRAGRAAAEWAQ